MLAEEHTSDDVLTAMRMGVDYTFTVNVRSLSVMLRPLSLSEQVEITNSVAEEVSTKPKHAQNSMTEASLLAIRTLERASSHGSVIGKLTAFVLQKMTNDEVMALFRAYNEGCDKLNPTVETITPKELDALVDAAKKNLLDLKALPQPRLVQLVRYLLTPTE